jgi:hypothetical protein
MTVPPKRIIDFSHILIKNEGEFMKKTALIIMTALALLLFAGCGARTEGGSSDNGIQGGNSEQAPTRTDGFTMIAKVKSVGDRVEVDVISAEYASGIFHIIVGENTLIYSALGNEITKQELKSGDTVEITYNGQIMLSYPPQVVALKIVIK